MKKVFLMAIVLAFFAGCAATPKYKVQNSSVGTPTNRNKMCSEHYCIE